MATAYLLLQHYHQKEEEQRLHQQYLQMASIITANSTHKDPEPTQSVLGTKFPPEPVPFKVKVSKIKTGAIDPRITLDGRLVFSCIKDQIFPTDEWSDIGFGCTVDLPTGYYLQISLRSPYCCWLILDGTMMVPKVSTELSISVYGIACCKCRAGDLLICAEVKKQPKIPFILECSTIPEITQSDPKTQKVDKDKQKVGKDKQKVGEDKQYLIDKDKKNN